jgi:hypothetical protein
MFSLGALLAVGVLPAACDLPGGGNGHSAADSGDGDARVYDARVNDARAGGEEAGDAPSGTTDAGWTEAGAFDGGSTCPSTMAVLATGGTSMAGAGFAHGQWSSANIVAGGASAAPSLVPWQGGYLGVFTGAGASAAQPLEWTAYGGSWSPPGQVGAIPAQGVPALAIVGGSAHVVYWGSDGKFYHGIYSGTWDMASDPVQPSGGGQSFGLSAPAAAGLGSTLLAVQSGQDGALFGQIWSGAWQGASALDESGVVTNLSPAVTVLGGGTADVMIVLAHTAGANNSDFQYITRTAGTASWSTPADVYSAAGNVAYADTAPSLAALPGGKAILAWRGGWPSHPYVSTYDPAAGWSAPVAVSSDTLASAPSVAPGVCGADATMVYVDAAGTVQIMSLSGGVWAPPVALAGVRGMQWAAIAATL